MADTLVSALQMLSHLILAAMWGRRESYKTNNCPLEFIGITLSIPSVPSPSKLMSVQICPKDLPSHIQAKLFLSYGPMTWLALPVSLALVSDLSPFLMSSPIILPLALTIWRPTIEPTTVQHQDSSLCESCCLPLAPGSTISFSYRILPGRTGHYFGLPLRWAPPGALSTSKPSDFVFLWRSDIVL